MTASLYLIISAQSETKIYVLCFCLNCLTPVMCEQTDHKNALTRILFMRVINNIDKAANKQQYVSMNVNFAVVAVCYPNLYLICTEVCFKLCKTIRLTWY